MSPSEYEQLVQFLGPRFETIDRRFDAMDGRFDEFRGEILGHFDEVYRRLERLEQEYHARIEDIERGLGSAS